MDPGEFSTWQFLATFSVSETEISGILPLELEPLNLLQNKIEESLLHHVTPVISNLPLILKKVKTRNSQIQAKTHYQAKCKELLEIIENQEDGEWETLNIQLNNNPEELKALKKKTLEEITTINVGRQTAEKHLKKWRKSTQKEGIQPNRSFEDALVDPDVTEPLLCSPNLKLILGEDSTSSKITLAEKFMKSFMPKEARNAAQEDQRFQTLLQILEPIKILLNPSPDTKMLRTMKDHISAKIQLSLAIDNRLLKLTLLPESPVNSDVCFQGEEEAQSIDEDEDAVVAVAGTDDPENILLKKLRIQFQNLMQMTKDLEPQTGGETMLIHKMTSKFEENLITLLSDCSDVNRSEIKKYRELLQNVRKIIPQDYGTVNKEKLKLKDIKLSSFTGKEEDYFHFKSELLDILKNSRNDLSSQCRAVKAECFNNCPKIFEIVRNCTSVDGIFQCLDERLGNTDRHALRIITSIEKFPAVAQDSKSIIAFSDFIEKISGDITGANVLEQVASFQTVSKIKSKFTPLMSRDYIRICSSNPKQSSVQEWETILSFLKQERDTALKISAFESTASNMTGKQAPNLSRINIIQTVPQTSSNKCVLCNGSNHLPFHPVCKKTGANFSSDTLSLIKKAKICPTCLYPGCKKRPCDNLRYTCEAGCKNGDGIKLHKRICDCNAAKNLHSKLNSQVSVKACAIKTPVSNKYNFGTSIMLSERAVIIDPTTNKPVRISIQYDSGATDSVCSENITVHGKLTDNVKNLHIGGFTDDFSTVHKNVNLYSFQLRTCQGLESVDAIQVSKLSIDAACQVQVPKHWEKYFFPGYYKVGGEANLLLGANSASLFPQEIDRFKQGGECLILYRSVVTGKYMLLGRNSLGTKFRNKPSPTVNRAQFFEDSSPQNIVPLPGASLVSKPGKCVVSHKDVDCNGMNDWHDLDSAPDHDLDLNLDLVSTPGKCVFSHKHVGCNGMNDWHDLDSTPEHDLDLNLDLDLASAPDLPSSMKKTVLAQIEEDFRRQLTAEYADTDGFDDHALKKKLAEEQVLKDGIKFDPLDKCWVVTYAYDPKIKLLKNNYNHVLQRMKKLNEKLSKNPDLCKKVNAEITKNVENGYWKKVTDVDFPAGSPIHYLPFNYVENPSSLSTPVRLVTDSSARDSSGLSLNMCQVSGCNNIGNMRGCLLKARTSQQIALGDISKFYNSFRLAPSDASLRRILLPVNGFGHQTGFDEYCQVRIPFGDKAAGSLAVMGRDKNADRFTADTAGALKDLITFIFKEMTYVDDVTATTSWDKDMDEVIDNLEKVANAGNLKFKNWIRLGDPEETKYLGYTWDPKLDRLKVKLWFNLGLQVRGAAVDGNLTLENVESKVMTSFSKKDAYAAMSQFFDPLLIFAPLVVKLRLFVGRVSQEKDQDDWDSQLSTTLKKEFINIIQEILPAADFSFPRSTIPKTGINFTKPDVEIICCTDGSLVAFAGVVYLRVVTPEGIHCNLLAARMKTVGNRKLTAPRTELMGAHLGVELTNDVIKEVKELVNIKKVHYFTDSRVVIGQLQHASGKFEMFVGNRVDYIQTHSDVSSWRWIPGDSNPADLPTRGNATLTEVMSDKWLHGGFLLQDEKSWPAKDATDFADNLPGMDNTILQANMLVKQLILNQDEEYVEPWSNLMNKFHDLSKVATVLGLCLKFKYPQMPLPQRRTKALGILFKDAMPLSSKMLEKIKCYDVSIEKKEDGIFARGRTKQSLNSNKLIVLSPKSAVAQLIFRDYHNKYGHLASIKKVQAKILVNFYIPRSYNPLMKMKRDCNLCKKLQALPMMQKMGDLKTERFVKSKPFTNILVDCLGPFTAFDAVKKRTTGKVWGMVISCCYSRAVWVTALENYSADAVISGLNRLKARFGQFQTVYSDLGTNLTAAGRLDQMDEEGTVFAGGEDLDKQFPDVTWKPGVPKAPWYMGGVECFVKQVKTQLRILRVKEGLQKLSHMEYETLFARISAIINERSLIKVPEPGNTISANDLLFGHNNNLTNQAGAQETNLTKRSSAIQENLKIWWSIYHANFEKVSASLPKWKNAEDNLEVNDIVLLLDSPNKVGSFKIGRVVQTYPDAHGLVRTVLVEYRTSQQNRMTRVKRQCRTLSRLTHQDANQIHLNDDVNNKVVDDVNDDVDDGVDHVNDDGNSAGIVNDASVISDRNTLAASSNPLTVTFAQDGDQTIVDLPRKRKKRQTP